MGRAKQWAIEQHEKGFNSKNTRLCSGCIDDHSLQEHIDQEGEVGYRCSYCDVGDQIIKTIPFDRFIERVLECIETEWGDPNNEGVAWDEGWVGDVKDTWDLFTEELDINFSKDELFHDVIDSLSDHQWCQKNFYGLTADEALSHGWKRFAKMVKHESRHVFFRRDDIPMQPSDDIHPSVFLDALGKVFSDCKLYINLDIGSFIYRVRRHAGSNKLTDAFELGPPPPEKAIYSNRMSPAGITAFYGASSKETALLETVTSKPNMDYATLAKFRSTKKLCLVDFTNLPKIPSIFQQNSMAQRSGILFLQNFLEDLTKPIQKDGQENIEYVPTQIVSEYLRYIHLNPDKEPIDGIIYRSAQNPDGIVYVIFIGPDAVSGVNNQKEATVLVLDNKETFEAPRNIDPVNISV